MPDQQLFGKHEQKSRFEEKSLLACVKIVPLMRNASIDQPVLPERDGVVRRSAAISFFYYSQ